jgi:L-aminoadipate-semialdehyde dehydrogenase
LGLIFEQPTIAGLVAAVESLRNADLGLNYQEPMLLGTDVNGPISGSGIQEKTMVAPLEYGQDYIKLLEQLKPSYPSLPSDFYDHSVTVFLTGATGFLGAFVLKDLLSREERVKKVICLVRGSDQEQAIRRLKEGSIDRGVWDDEWVKEGRLEVVTGDLGLEGFGLVDDTWNRIAAEADVILHNGALVCVIARFFIRSSIIETHTLGPLGLSLRAPEGSKCDCNADCYGTSFEWQAEVTSFRQLHFCD